MERREIDYDLLKGRITGIDGPGIDEINDTSGIIEDNETGIETNITDNETNITGGTAGGAGTGGVGDNQTVGVPVNGTTYTSYSVEADNQGVYPGSISVSPGESVAITFTVRGTSSGPMQFNVLASTAGWGTTEDVQPGDDVTVYFIAPMSGTIQYGVYDEGGGNLMQVGNVTIGGNATGNASYEEGLGGAYKDPRITTNATINATTDNTTITTGGTTGITGTNETEGTTGTSGTGTTGTTTGGTTGGGTGGTTGTY